MRYNAARYPLIDGVLYYRGFSLPYFKCIGTEDAEYMLKEIQKGNCIAIGILLAHHEEGCKGIRKEMWATPENHKHTVVDEERTRIRRSDIKESFTKTPILQESLKNLLELFSFKSFSLKNSATLSPTSISLTKTPFYIWKWLPI